MKRDELVIYLDDFLQVKTIEDSSNNGLQVEGTDDVTRMAFAVDASLAAIERAQAAGAQMLVVHHGLYWSKVILVTGVHRQRLGRMFGAGLSLYASHLPLDIHAEVGNNAVLARLLELDKVVPFGEYKGSPTGFSGSLAQPLTLEQFAARVEGATGEPVIQTWPFGSDTVQRVGIVSGGAAFLVDQAAEAGVDVYLTGEMSHNFYHQAQELGLNVVFGGHYATETVGLKSLAVHLTDRFGLETVFIDLPTGA